MLGLGATLALGFVAPVRAAPATTFDVYKDPNCGCCTNWVAHLSQHGFNASVTDAADMAAIKTRLGVPRALASCHTAQLNNYVIEGHVPAHAIRRLLAEKPDAIGLAVPGMPIGSPGMEGGEPETYDVILFGKAGETPFGRYIGNQPV